MGVESHARVGDDAGEAGREALGVMRRIRSETGCKYA
jgi:hypothetical protein